MKAIRTTKSLLSALMMVTVLGACASEPVATSAPQVIKETVVVVKEVTSATVMDSTPAEQTTPQVVPSATIPASPQVTEAPEAAIALEETITPSPQTAQQPTASPPASPTPLPSPDVIWDTLPTLTVVPLIADEPQTVLLIDPPVQFINPEQVARVDFSVVDPDGQVVFQSSDTSAPFCPFGDLDAGCAAYNLNTSSWPNGMSQRGGQHTLTITAYDRQGMGHTQQVAFNLPEQPPNVSWDQLPALSTVAVAPAGGGLGFLNLTGILAVTFRNPADIARVNFAIYDFDDQLVYQRLDGDLPFCIFGDADPGCRTLRFDTAQWPAGEPLRLGPHVLVITAHDQQDRTSERRISFRVNVLPRSVSGSATPAIKAPQVPTKRPVLVLPGESTAASGLKAVKIPGGPAMQLVYPPEAKGSFSIQVTTKSPEEIAKIEFVVLDGNGKVVNTETETTPKYCAFGGSETCTAIRLEEGAQWPSTGIPIHTGTYTVKVTVFGKADGQWRIAVPFKVYMPGEF